MVEMLIEACEDGAVSKSEKAKLKADKAMQLRDCPLASGAGRVSRVIPL